jgi:putative membrane protein
MCTALTYLSESARKEVEGAIADAEKRTGAEIVCAIATESGRYDRAESLAGLIGSLLGIAALHWVAVARGGETWHEPAASLAGQSLAVVIGFVAGSMLASHGHTLRRLLCSRAEMEAEVQGAAARVFMNRGLAVTSNRGAVLVYVSLFERRLVVLADAGAKNAAGIGLEGSVCEAAQKELRGGKRGAAMLAALKPIVETLSSKFPVAAGDRNELTDTVVLVHPRP